MKTIKSLRSVSLLMLATSSIALSSCHAPAPEAAAEQMLPVVELNVREAAILPDGSIRIKQDQIVQHIGTNGVFILSSNQRARFRMVKAGKKSDDTILISSGLTGKEQILSGSFDSVFDGSPVNIVKTRDED